MAKRDHGGMTFRSWSDEQSQGVVMVGWVGVGMVLGQVLGGKCCSDPILIGYSNNKQLKKLFSTSQINAPRFSKLNNYCYPSI